jgi:thymidine kinase
MYCKDGTPGPFTKRIVDNKELELIGGTDMYRAACRKHL